MMALARRLVLQPALSLVLLYLATSEVRAHCPPCHHGNFRRQAAYWTASLAQEGEKNSGRPWGVMVPPAPNAPLTACGCGVNKVTPRDELKELEKPEIADKIRDLEKTDKDLEDDCAKAKAEHSDEISDLTSKLDGLKEGAKKQRGDIEAVAAKRQGEMKETKEKSADDFEEIKIINKELGDLRDRDKDVRAELTLRLMDMERCGCKPSEDLLQKSSTMVRPLVLAATVSRQAPPSSKAAIKDVNKVEDLEEKKGVLMDQQQEEQAEFGEKSRDLMNKIDMMNNKIERQEIQEKKIKATDKRIGKTMKFQGKAQGTWLEKKQAQVARFKEDVKKDEETYEKLEKELGKCGCGPQGR